jgi:hypothetical protein
LNLGYQITRNSSFSVQNTPRVVIDTATLSLVTKFNRYRKKQTCYAVRKTQCFLHHQQLNLRETIFIFMKNDPDLVDFAKNTKLSAKHNICFLQYRSSCLKLKNYHILAFQTKEDHNLFRFILKYHNLVEIQSKTSNFSIGLFLQLFKMAAVK